MVSLSSQKKDLNFELNLIPMIDVFSACICFLLITVVWIHVGSVETRQALGQPDENLAGRTLIVRMENTGELSVRMGDKSEKFSQRKLPERIRRLHRSQPQIHAVVLVPHQNSNYQDILNVMDEFRHVGFKDIGVTPL